MTSTAVRIVGNETAKGLRIWWANWATVLPELLVLAGLFLALQYLLGGGRIVAGLVAPTMLGFLPYVFAYLAIVKLVAGVVEELQAGTLEQTHLSPLPAWLLSLGRLASAIVQDLLPTILLGAGYLIALHAAMDLRLPWRWPALLPAGLLVADVAGFALLLGGLALRVSTVGAITHVLLSLVMLVNGAFVPISAFPDWLQALARLAPTTLGVEVTRRVLLDGQPLSAAWADQRLVWLLLHAAALLAAGWTLWQWNIRRGLRNGRLGPQWPPSPRL
ncbi:MAG TPA: ABC transporter permease [Actinomycetes bacterium]|nr:ABC transporter permease [Actinomycetes bacterium]